MQLQYVIRKQMSRVDLHKDGRASIGIVLKDGVKTGSRPVIKSIKKGSVAYRSHCVSEKDAIVSVCGQDARGMGRKNFKHLLREAESKIELELEYQIREACLSKCGVYRMERIYLKLKKESESYGFVLRKNGFRYPASPGYPVISNIREGGPADRDGRLKAGDRLLQIDDQDLEALSLSQVADILQAKNEATFTVEYKIALVENSQIQLGERTNLEIDCPDAELGLVLGPSGSRVIIEEIHKGSLADRCGAFRVGDDILAINDIDVSFLSTSKANSLLRSFRKEPGRLVLVANVERLARPRQNKLLHREKINPLFNELPPRLTPEAVQQVSSNNHPQPRCNNPQSLFNRSFEETTCLIAERDHYNFQIEAIVMIREIIKNCASLENCILSLNSNNDIGLEENLDELEKSSNMDQTLQSDKISCLKILSTRIQNSVNSIAMHMVNNARIDSNPSLESCERPFDSFKDNSQQLNHQNVIQELMKNLVEIYTKKLMSKQILEKLQLKINQINSNCKKCEESCMLAALTTHKILLIVSLSNKTKHIFSLIQKLIEDVLKILPCKDCRVSSRSQTGSEIGRITPHFSSLNQLSPKPSCSTRVLKGKTSRSTVPNGYGKYGTDGVKSLDHLHNRPSSNVSSLLSNQTKFESQMSADDDSLANVTISNVSCSESQSGSDISKTPHLKSMNHLSPKPFCSTRVLKGKTTCSTVPNGYGKYGTDDVKSLDHLHNSPSSNVSSLLSNQTKFKSQMSVDDDSLANVTISNISCPESQSGSDISRKTPHLKSMNHLSPKPSCSTHVLKEKTCSIAQNKFGKSRTDKINSLKPLHNKCSSSVPSLLSYQTGFESQLSLDDSSQNVTILKASCPETISNFNGKTKTGMTAQPFYYEKRCQSQLKAADKGSLCFDTPSHQSEVKAAQNSSLGFATPICDMSLCDRASISGESSPQPSTRTQNNTQNNSFYEAELQPCKDNTRFEQKDNGNCKNYSSNIHKKIFREKGLLNSQRKNCKSAEVFADSESESLKHSSARIQKHASEPDFLSSEVVQDRVDVTLRNEGKGYGLNIEFLGQPSEDSALVPYITSVSSQGAAHKIGVLQKGDRVLSINGQNTNGMTFVEFNQLKEEAFSADEVLLTVEFDVIERDLHFGTFDVCVTKTSKTGLIYNDFKKGSPLVVKGMVKGSPAHRCGSLFPGDEVLYAKNIRQEFYDVFKNTYERTEFVIIRVRRQTFEEKFGDEINLDRAESSHFKSYDLTRTSIHSNHDNNNMFLEQELVLYRDPVARDFGFLIGQDQSTKTIYVTGIRPDGPAECSKVIRKNDIILQVNGVDIETHRDGPIVSLFQPTGDRLELKTRRILKYE